MVHFECDMNGINHYKNQDIFGYVDFQSFLYFRLVVSRKKKKNLRAF